MPRPATPLLSSQPKGTSAAPAHATARDGRFTWRGEAEPRVFGPVVLAARTLRFTPQISEDTGASLTAAATVDDMLAWSYAAMWWRNHAVDQYDAARRATASLRQRIPEWPAGGPDDDRLAPDVNLSDWGLLGGTDRLHERAVFSVLNWPAYFDSMADMILLSATQRRLITQIKLQAILRRTALLFWRMQRGDPALRPLLQER